MSVIVLTDDQKKALGEIIEFINGTKNAHTLIGFAGTGKTTLTKEVRNYARIKELAVVGVAPTHKAVKILQQSLNTNAYTPTMTIAKLLNVMKEQSYVGTKNFRSDGTSKIEQYDLVLVDECSMISDDDVKIILMHVKKSNKKVLFIGDRAQIPNPRQTFIPHNDGTIYKKDSVAFDLPYSELKTIVRQAAGNPILEISYAIRKDLFEEPNINRITNVKDNKGVRFYDDQVKFLKRMKHILIENNNAEIKIPMENIRVVCYTNERVQYYNRFVRSIMKYTEPFVVGEVLTGYNMVGYPTPIVENGQDYVIEDVKYGIFKIKLGKSQIELEGHQLTMYNPCIEANQKVFFPDISSEINSNMLAALKILAKKVNSSYSSTIDYKKYKSMKDRVLFLESVYEYNNVLMPESMLKSQHPILFKQTDQFISKDRKIIQNEFTDGLSAEYIKIIKNRIADKKGFLSGERLVDQFQIIEKDMDYGYAITAHKSQASTYHTVFIDECDFEKLSGKWNWQFRKTENNMKEKNQLKYVAFTRATDLVVSYY